MELINRLKRHFGEYKIEEKEISFTNNDVPEFLKYLHGLEKRARRDIMKDRKRITGNYQGRRLAYSNF